MQAIPKQAYTDMYWKVEGSLESLHTIWRVVLWRR
jgi:hypothetical protein